jgi:hypothetical protein
MQLKKITESLYEFPINGKEIQIDFTGDGVEIFEKANPATTGFVFDSVKEFILFINSSSDLVEIFKGEI